MIVRWEAARALRLDFQFGRSGGRGYRREGFEGLACRGGLGSQKLAAAVSLLPWV